MTEVAGHNNDGIVFSNLLCDGFQLCQDIIEARKVCFEHVKCSPNVLLPRRFVGLASIPSIPSADKAEGEVAIQPTARVGGKFHPPLYVITLIVCHDGNALRITIRKLCQDDIHLVTIFSGISCTEKWYLISPVPHSLVFHLVRKSTLGLIQQQHVGHVLLWAVIRDTEVKQFDKVFLAGAGNSIGYSLH